MKYEQLTELEQSILSNAQNDLRALIYSSLDNKIHILNEIKKMMHDVSPFKTEPVDCVLWVKNNTVHANDYNPNSVAPPEMELLRLSISNDGYTQPIVSMDNGDETREVIDGFHRNRVGKECADIQKRVNGYLPVVTIRQSQKDKSNRIASTIRHNRARGKHSVDSMSDIIVDLKKRNWSPKKIGKELGMDADEVLRLSQISGLVELFKDKEFSNAWTTEEE
jgi:ParB-like chromosome segregation protein Spo0J